MGGFVFCIGHGNVHGIWNGYHGWIRVNRLELGGSELGSSLVDMD